MELLYFFWESLCQAGKYVADHMVLLNFLLSIVIIFFQRKEPKSAWAWLLVLNALPGVGFLLYLLAGTDMHKRSCTGAARRQKKEGQKGTDKFFHS